MKTIVNISLGGRAYTVDEDAYQKLNSYLKAFRERSRSGSQSAEVMDEVERSIADIFDESLSKRGIDVVDESIVSTVISRLGMPDGSSFSQGYSYNAGCYAEKPEKRLFLDKDNAKIGGVCGGLAAYLGIDVVLVRVLFVLMLFFCAGLIIYLVFWIAVPSATTAAQKCMMRGEPITAENMRKYSTR